MIRTKINRQVAKSVLIALFPVAAFAGASAFGQGCPPRFTENFDGVTPPVLPSGWMASQGVNVAGAPIWGTSTITPDTPPNDVFSTAPDNILDNRLQVGLFAGSYDNTVSFRQTYNLEDGFDGAVLEVSIPYINGGAFTDITDPAVGGSFFSGGYNRTISTAFQSPIAGRMAWSGNSGGYITTLAFLGARIVDTTFVTLRFRLATDNRVASTGWRIDTFVWNHNECPPPTGSPSPVPTPNPTPTPCPASWPAGPSLPTGVARSAGVYFSGNGRFYALGGHAPGAAGSELIHPLEYDPEADTWTIKAATFPDAQVNDMACGLLVDSGTLYIYCVGGSAVGATTAANRVFRYNPLADTISGVAAPWPGNSGGDTLPGGFTVLQNKLYLLGGFQIDTAMTNQIWEFTPGTNAWVQKSAVLPVALGYVPTTTIGNLIYTAGGSRFTAPGTLDDSTNAYFYNPAADVITAIANIPRATGETLAVTMNNQMWVLGGGRTAPNPSAEVNIYDPVTGLWTAGPSFATARRNFPAANDGGSRIWLGGGCATDCAAPLNSMEIFQCNSPTPTATPPAATPTPTPTPTSTPTVTPTATPTPAPVSILGTVLYCSNPVPGPVPNVTLTLTGTMSGFTSSDSSGNYTFSSLPSGGNYAVTPTKAARTPGSANINTVDVIATQRHFLNLGPPLSGCRLTAADVNGDAAINTVDVIAIQRFFLGLSTGIANTGKYQFTPVNRTYTGIVGNQTGQDYDTLVFGDVAAPFVEP